MMNAREIPPPNPDSSDSGPDEPPDERDVSNRPLPVTGADPDVGLSQKGTGEDAVIRRETEI